MNWLLSRPLRPFVALAAFASLLLNQALAVPSLRMLQVFDRRGSPLLPADVSVTTPPRSPLRYLLGPLGRFAGRALREP